MRRVVLLLGAAFLAASAGAATVLGSFSPALFSAQQAKDGLTLLQFHAEDCSVCPAQESTLERLAGDPAYRDILCLQARWEREEELRRHWRVESVSSLLLFKGKRLIGRVVGLYTEDDIRAFVLKARRQDRGRPKTRPERRFSSRR